MVYLGNSGGTWGGWVYAGIERGILVVVTRNCIQVLVRNTKMEETYRSRTQSSCNRTFRGNV